MRTNIEETSTLRRKVTIELEPGEIAQELNRAYDELRRTVRLKGFRPGRAPRKLLERFFGDHVRGDTIQNLIKQYTGKALSELALEPVAPPEVVTEETDLAKALRFSAVFDVKPQFVVKDYENFKLLQPRVEVKDEEVEAALQRMRERQAVLRKEEGRDTVEAGDFVLGEIECWHEGKPLSGFKLEGRIIRVSPDSLPHGLDGVLIGAKLGEPVRKTKSYPPEYGAADLAGKTVEWRATVKEIFRRELPALDDDFARDQGDCQSLEELRQRIREQLMEQAHAEGQRRLKQGLLDLILERNQIEAPESMVEAELRALEAEFAATLEMGGMASEQAAAAAREHRDELRVRAEKNVRSTLVLDALAEQEKVEVSDEELAERVAALVRQAERDRPKVAEFYRDEERRAALRRSMRREKTIELMLGRSQIESEAQAEEQSTEP
jgi:trigger factor